MPYKHGVYVTEQDTSLTAPISGTSGLQVVFGTAPVNLAEKPYESANVPFLCNSFAEAVKNVGYSDDFKKYTLCQSIDASFRVFSVAPVILVNVLDPNNDEHKTKITDADHDVENHKIKISDSGEKVFGILKDTVKIKSSEGDTDDVYTENEDYIIDFDSNGYILISFLPDSDAYSATRVKISYEKLNPSAISATDIIGGIDASTGDLKGLECVSKIFPMFGMTPGLILAPGFSSDANVIAALEAKTTFINGSFSCECIVDIGSDAENATGTAPISALKYTDVKIAKENLGADSPHTIACWPCGVIGSKVYAMSALIGALISYTDALNDDVPCNYPSNKSLGITGIALADGTKVIIDQEQANVVNSYGVVTAINYNGYKAWGNNTAAYPSTTDPKDRWIAVRRMFSWWGNTLILTYHQKVDDPANYRLVENIVDSENIRGNSFVARDLVAEARVEFNQEENSVIDIMNGEIKFHIYLTPFTPAENIEFILEFNPYALETALSGGEE